MPGSQCECVSIVVVSGVIVFFWGVAHVKHKVLFRHSAGCDRLIGQSYCSLVEVWVHGDECALLTIIKEPLVVGSLLSYTVYIIAVKSIGHTE